MHRSKLLYLARFGTTSPMTFFINPLTPINQPLTLTLTLTLGSRSLQMEIV